MEEQIISLIYLKGSDKIKPYVEYHQDKIFVEAQGKRYVITIKQVIVKEK
jgi:hypothetical protein